MFQKQETKQDSLEFSNCGCATTSHKYVIKSVKAFVTGTVVEKSNKNNN